MSNDKSKDTAALAAATTSANRATITAAIATPSHDRPAPKDTRSHEQIKADALRNRAELAATLDAIEYRINVPKRAANRLRVLREENPAVLAAAGVAAAALVGVAVWLGVRAFSNR